MNVVVLKGALSRPADERELASGTRLLTMDVTVDRPGERAESAPVVWFDPPASASRLDVGLEVLVLGRVRRRFFKAGAGTQSRTEVVALGVVPANQARRAGRMLAQALAALDGAAACLAANRRA